LNDSWPRADATACLNCHSFVHLREPPLGIDEAKEVVVAIKALLETNDPRRA